MKDLTNEFISSLDVNYEIETELKLFREIENLGELSYDSTMILLDHLFDIDGLIPLGLAIDYNVVANVDRES
ncbi:hypothetical protein OIU83_09875 [Flavobacterium sp. LS1R49]|uniref:Uncharacterized protein n=1 Tax=Flavobacterium shii TaxID=2987687 RepID=A0A9X2ZG54_9FLAO|nr:hypothetical protein [Flavobacterium shii]MCV9927962.1 hypothetical protein [Flavobacterium shii]